MDYLATVKYSDGYTHSFKIENDNGYDLDINEVLDIIDEQIDEPYEIRAITKHRSTYQ